MLLSISRPLQAKKDRIPFSCNCIAAPASSCLRAHLHLLGCVAHSSEADLLMAVVGYDKSEKLFGLQDEADAWVAQVIDARQPPRKWDWAALRKQVE